MNRANTALGEQMRSLPEGEEELLHCQPVRGLALPAGAGSPTKGTPPDATSLCLRLTSSLPILPCQDPGCGAHAEP